MGVEENNNKKLIVFKFNESKADVLSTSGLMYRKMKER